MSGERSLDTLNIAAEESYADGEVIFEEGSSGDWIYLIMAGEVEIYKTVRGRKVVVDVLKRGDIFGEVSFVDKQPRSAAARALGEVQVGIYDRTFLSQEYNKLPLDFRAVFDALARRLRKMTTVASNLVGRKTERAAQTIEIHFRTAKDFFKAFSTNIGGGGLFVHSQNLLPAGSEVNLKFNLPGESTPIRTGGRVAWVRETPEAGLGVQFVNLSPEDAARINAFVRQKQGE